jgi:hypothetical protein
MLFTPNVLVLLWNKLSVFRNWTQLNRVGTGCADSCGASEATPALKPTSVMAAAPKVKILVLSDI